RTRSLPRNGRPGGWPLRGLSFPHRWTPAHVDEALHLSGPRDRLLPTGRADERDRLVQLEVVAQVLDEVAHRLVRRARLAEQFPDAVPVVADERPHHQRQVTLAGALGVPLERDPGGRLDHQRLLVGHHDLERGDPGFLDVLVPTLRLLLSHLGGPSCGWVTCRTSGWPPWWGPWVRCAEPAGPAAPGPAPRR